MRLGEFTRLFGLIALLGPLAACSDPGADDAGPDEGADTDEPHPNSIPEACVVEGEGPQDIPELVAHINALPHPVTIPCVLASLPRPLSVVATNGEFSVQPADGDDNPRIFVLGEGLVFSVVPIGEGRELLEFSEWISPSYTIKGEIPFPVDEVLSPDDPYDLDFQEGLTRCGVCHRNEYEFADRPGAFASEAIRPTTESLVPVSSLDAVLDACDWDDDPDRCNLLSGLLDYGEVLQGEFSDELPTIFDE